MRILLTNDDGIDAPGLSVLEKIAAQISSDLWIVAPRTEQSGAARSFSFSSPLRINQRDPRRFSVEGTPVDCVMMAVHRIMKKKKKPDLILSGVNRGQNIAEDVTYSGTISAAAEGANLFIPSIALSQAFGFKENKKKNQISLHWETAAHHAPALIRKLIKQSWPGDIVLNINFPDRAPDDVEGVLITKQGKRDRPLTRVKESHDLRGLPYYWLGFKRVRSNPKEGTDLHAIYSGYISITPLHFNLTHEGTHGALSKKMKSVLPSLVEEGEG